MIAAAEAPLYVSEMGDFLDEILFTLVAGGIVIVPLRRIFARAGLPASRAFLVFVPYLGLIIVPFLLALTRWPSTEGPAPTAPAGESPAAPGAAD